MSSGNTSDVRRHFLDYFAKHGHLVLPSGPLVPPGDKTLLFTNAGMVPFKDVFVGREAAKAPRAASCQKCMRVSGKHNDLEEVGRTARHHTFFEMLGNFSFGDYFKEEAIVRAWDLIANELKLDPKRLYVTVFGGSDVLPKDEEARTLWRKVSGLPDSRILDMGAADNFWQMGETGPCGPCTEIHYDQGQGPVRIEDFASGRVMEIWNNVFMQFDRQADGQLKTLPRPSVDTGMGLERITALLEGQNSNYHTPLFLPLIEEVEQAAHKRYGRTDSEDDISMRVIADHARATAFLVADGIQPGNEGRSYVLRRIMRRAVRHAGRLGIKSTFFHRVTERVVTNMQSTYPELARAQSLISKVAETEEEGFRRTLDTGMNLLGDTLARLKTGGHPTLDGAVAFQLYDTFGFPLDLTHVIAQERGIEVDTEGFELAMAQQRARSRKGQATRGQEALTWAEILATGGPTLFIGGPDENVPLSERPEAWRHAPDCADRLEVEVKVRAVVHEPASADSPTTKDALWVVLDPTPFYAESGGQVGDSGIITRRGHSERPLKVLTTQRKKDGLSACLLEATDSPPEIGEVVWAGYSRRTRSQIRGHHSATHLLHGALRKVLGDHVKQAGSLVDDQHLRFDFSHFAAVTPEELAAVEQDVAARIHNNSVIKTEELALEDAHGRGAMALFGEKYGDRVRVVTMGDSIELCGGTHAHTTGDLRLLVVTREESVQSGVRRIEAEVGVRAEARLARAARGLDWVRANFTGGIPPESSKKEEDPELEFVQATLRKMTTRLAAVAEFAPPALKTSRTTTGAVSIATARARRQAWLLFQRALTARPHEQAALLGSVEDLPDRDLFDALFAREEAIRRREQAASGEAAGRRDVLAQELTKDAQALAAGGRFLAKEVALAPEHLKNLADVLRRELGEGIIALAARHDGRATLIVSVSPALVAHYQAGALVREIAPLIAGRGGGRPAMAQAGGDRPEGIVDAFARLHELLKAPEKTA